ncbi:diguanylate cyclase [Vibrio sp. CAU 1672]|uniref:diguanylate cyclase domain-containing protein n=1 Tax=Vibrio sp. CAU 1672 TaxID=3032594 RepID=UPI0023DA1097|nr:diguanylate cyclase [Vibrio sp. CAU 1672]
MWYRFKNLIITPLDKLNNSIHKLSIEPRLVHQIAHQSTDEVGTTITSFNVLIHRLQQRKKQLEYNFEQCDKEKTLIQQMCNLMSDSLIVINAEGGVLYVNEAAKRTFKRYQPVRGNTSIYELFPTNQQEELKALIDTNTTSTELTLSLHEHSLHILCRKFRHQENTFLSVKDITEEEQVLSKQRAAVRVFETSQDGLIVLNQEGIITMINPAVTKLLGVSAEQAVGESLFHSIRWRKLQALMPTIIESIKNYGHWQGEIMEKKCCGQLIPLFAKVNRIDKHSHNDFYEIVIMLTDLSGVKEMEYLKYQVHHDALTGLANRTKFTSQLQQLLSSSRYLRNEFAVLFLDLDGFKQVNDSYGHDAGDTVLQVIAERLALLSGHNDMVARFSGDEFVMLVNPATADIVRQIAKEVIASVSKPIFHKGIPLTVGISIGVKLVGPEENDPKHILAHADTAMYQAKQAGKGQAVFVESKSYEGV